MNGRRSFDHTTNSNAKPYNINIYYNINSKNITNNNQVQSHPVTARVFKNTIEENEKVKKNEGKVKNCVKARKKKLSVDLTIPTDKKTQKIGKKSNSNSICSGYASQTNYRRDLQKQQCQRKKLENKGDKVQKNYQKLSQLLQIFSEGKIDKSKLSKEIINLFQVPQQTQQDIKQKKINKKKRSVTTLIGTNTTPKNNQIHRIQAVGAQSTKAVMSIHKARKRQSKSQKSHFIYTRNQITQKIIQCRGIDSSLFLQPEQQQKVLPIIVDRTNDVETSHSIILLNQNLKTLRKIFPKQQQENSIDKKNQMAKKIQRAWRKYKTRKLIMKILYPIPYIKTDSNSHLQKIQCVSSSKKSIQIQNFLSQQLNRRNAIKQTQIARVQQLKGHQLQKWNQVINFVKISIDNSNLSKDQCIHEIVQYFQNAKNKVEKQLLLQKNNLSQKKQRNIGRLARQERSRQLTQFTNKVMSRQFQPEQNYNDNVQDALNDQMQQQFEYQEGVQNNSDLNDNKNQHKFAQSQKISIQIQQDQQQQQQDFLQQQGNDQNQQQTSQFNHLFSQRIVLSPSESKHQKIKKSQNLSVEVIQNTLLSYLKKLQTQHQKQIKSLQKNSINYLQQKLKLEKQCHNQKKQIRRIISNLNKGYNEAKNILQKQFVLSSQDAFNSLKNSNSKQTLQKCKSDNYLLKTAINYKKYIQKKQREQIGNQQKQISVSVQAQAEKQGQPYVQSAEQQEKQYKMNKNTQKFIIKNLDNLQFNSAESCQFSQNSVGKDFKNLIKCQINCDQLQNKNYPLDNSYSQLQSGEGSIVNINLQKIKQDKFSRLQQKILSQQFLQYEQIHKKLEGSQNQNQQYQLKSLKQNSHKAQQISLFENTRLNQINRKLKFLTKQDKDDIFQFLFIDLTLELITEYDQDTLVYQSIRKYVEKKKRLQAIPKGVKTNLQACKDYLGFIGDLIQNKPQYFQMLSKHIVVPMGPTAREMLKYMRDQEEQFLQTQQNQEISVPLILPVHVFQIVQQKIIADYPRYYDDDTKQQSRRKFLKSVDHIHHKSIFDSLNQSLDAERPFGIWGVPFPWKITPKINQIKRQSALQKQKIKQKFQSGIQKVIQNCTYMCGILADKEDSVFGNHKFSDNYIQQIRQDRMSKMLAHELSDNQDRWAFYDDQQTQVLIELTKSLAKHLVKQFIDQFRSINKNSG